jgi:hypothetical protein
VVGKSMTIKSYKEYIALQKLSTKKDKMETQQE